VDVTIDGVVAGAHYGDPRPDVCAVYPGASGCAFSGWDYLLDTTTLVDGVHTLQVTEFDFRGYPYTATTSFSVANGGNAVKPTKIYIDQPTPQATLLGTTIISGWAINDSAAVTSVAILVDGIQKGTATYGANRMDVCAVYPNRTGCPSVGWTFPLDTTLLANGSHVLQATASVVQGNQVQYGATSTVFTAANWTTNPTRITIDRPGSQAASSSGVMNAYGWAIDDYEAVTGVSISIDGVSYGAASYGATR
jgi:hypothetical protein